MSELAPKSKFVGVRIEPEQQRKLILLSLNTDQPGNMSAGLRWWLDQAKISGNVKTEEIKADPRPDKAAAHA